MPAATGAEPPSASRRLLLGPATALGLVAALVYGMAAYLRVTRFPPNGDEPHYLIFNEALLRYGSLDLTQAYENRDYWSFFPWPIEAHLVDSAYGPMPLHSFGGPLLWHIPYLIAGRAGVLAFVALISALTIVNIFHLLRELGITERYALITTALMIFGGTVYVYSSMSFVEPFGVLIVIFAVRSVAGTATPERWRIALAAAGLGALPWIHGRFIVLTVCIGALLLWRAGRRFLWMLPAAVLVGGLELYHLIKWHTLSPSPGVNAYGYNILRLWPWEGGQGLLFDPYYGVITNFPIYGLCFAGILLAVRRAPIRTNVILLGPVLPYVLALTTYDAWWAGASPPGRFLAVVLPVLSFYLAFLLQHFDNWWFTIAMTGLALIAFHWSVRADLGPVGKFALYPDPVLSHRIPWIAGTVVATIAVWWIGSRRRQVQHL